LFSYLFLRMEPSDPSLGFCLLFFKTIFNEWWSHFTDKGNDGKRRGPTFSIWLHRRPSWMSISTV
jgi:hypothetical protein